MLGIRGSNTPSRLTRLLPLSSFFPNGTTRPFEVLETLCREEFPWDVQVNFSTEASPIRCVWTVEGGGRAKHWQRACRMGDRWKSFARARRTDKDDTAEREISRLTEDNRTTIIWLSHGVSPVCWITLDRQPVTRALGLRKKRSYVAFLING